MKDVCICVGLIALLVGGGLFLQQGFKNSYLVNQANVSANTCKHVCPGGVASITFSDVLGCTCKEETKK